MQEIILVIEYLFYFYTAYMLVCSKNHELVFLLFVFSQMLLFPNINISNMALSHPSYAFPILVLFRSYYIDHTLKQRWKMYPIKLFTLALMAFHIIQPFFISWLPIGLAEYREIMSFSSSYLMIFWGFLLCPNILHIQKLVKAVLVVSSIVLLVMFYCKIIGNNPIPLAFSDTGEILWGSEEVETARGFRVTGLMGSPNLMGNICVILTILIFHFCKGIIYKSIYIILLLVAVVFTGTRAPIIVMLGGFAIYSLFQNKEKHLKTILFTILFYFLMIYIIPLPPQINTYIDSVQDIFLTGSKNTSGSSIELRESQLETSISIGMKAPIMGNGIGYVNQLMRDDGIFRGLYVRYDGNLAGAEGYPFFVLIEYGFIYFVLVFLFFVDLYRVLIKYITNKIIRNYSIIAITLLSSFLIYIISSYPANSWQMYCPLVGAFLYRCILWDKLIKIRKINNL